MPLIDSRPEDLAKARRRLDDVFVRAGEIRRSRIAIGVAALCVVLAAAAVTVRVLPSGSSSAVAGPPSSRPAPGQAASSPISVPSPFPVGAVAAVGAQQWWVLGTQATCAGTALCVAHTTDGVHYVELAGPRAPFGTGAAGAVARLAFQPDGIHGYAWGPGLWVTADGGRTWTDVPNVDVVDLQAGQSSAYLLAKTCSAASCPVALDSLTTTGSGPAGVAPVPTPAAASKSTPTAIAVDGSTLIAAYANGTLYAFGSVNAVLPEGCPTPRGAAALVALDAAHLVALCPAGGSYQAYQLTEAAPAGTRNLGLPVTSGTAAIAATSGEACVVVPAGSAACTAGGSLAPSAPGQVVELDQAGGTLFAVVASASSGTLERAIAGQAWVAVPIGR